MKYGNCLFGAIYAMIKLKTWKIRIMKGTGFIPHFYVIKDGEKWHYEVGYEVLPFPFNIFWYRGILKQIT